LGEASTSWVGVSLLVELFRRSGVNATANEVLPARGSAKGLKQGQIIESFVLLSALGGEGSFMPSESRSLAAPKEISGEQYLLISRRHIQGGMSL